MRSLFLSATADGDHREVETKSRRFRRCREYIFEARADESGTIVLMSIEARRLYRPAPLNNLDLTTLKAASDPGLLLRITLLKL